MAPQLSGLVDYAYARAGMPLPGRPTAAVLWQMSRPVGRAHLAPGDLAFLYTRRRAPYHVALYAGDLAGARSAFVADLSLAHMSSTPP